MSTLEATRPEDCLATHAGELQLGGLDGAITIVRDRWGVPHIRAASAHDAFFAQGFCIAQDRLWQLELYRHMAHGRAASLLNKGLLRLDVQNRRLGFGRLAATEWEHQSADARMVLQAYANGVNAAIATQPRPFEFVELDHTMAPWSPIDSLAVIKMVNSGNQWASKLKFGQIASKLGAEAVEALVAGVPVGAALITPSGARWTGEPHPFKEDILSAMGQPDGPQNSGGGSNCWVIHGSRTASGWPLVAGDPHLGLSVPAQWYLVHMECPEFTVAGPCNPCYPGPVFYGHNTHVAWTMTHAQGDRWDVYRERLRRGPAGPEALSGESWEPLQRMDESFAVRDQPAVQETVWLTRHGPVIFGDPLVDDEVLAARWGLADPAHDTDAMLAMLRASNLDEARAAVRRYDSVSGNYCFADIAGRIAYQCSGRIPARPAWLLPVPGWDGQHEWSGDVPKEELPIGENPDNGFFVTANNRTTTPDYPHYLTYMATRFRADRLRELLDPLKAATPADCQRLQSDLTSIHARDMAAWLTRTLAPDAAAARLQGILSGWDGHMPVDSAAALVFDFVCDALAERTLRAYFAPAYNVPEFTVMEQRRVLYEQMAEDASLMLVNDASWDAAAHAALAAAAARIEERFGPDPAAWRWGDAHVVSWRHNLGRDERLAATFNVGDVPVGGHGDTPFNTMTEHGAASTHGVSYRQIIDLADVNAMQVCLPPGNSGQPGSPHYADGLEDWRDVTYHPLHIDWSDIQANAESTLMLIPT
ncbi:MAG: penicillin acylase family protein [Dehalococcoidia bacterium]